MVDERRIIADGLAAYAVSGFEMGHTKEEVRGFLLSQWERLGAQPGAFRDAFVAIRSFPQPVLESAEETESAAPIRTMLGVAPAEDQLTAALAAMELLSELAAEP